MTSVYSRFRSTTSKTQIALLLDPDECTQQTVQRRMEIANRLHVDFIFIGGSLVTSKQLDDCIAWVRSSTDLPLVLFPGNDSHISPEADAVLLLSLISGRNPDLLIGKHVQAAPLIRQYGLETISTGYMLIESGPLTSVQYMSNTTPLPRNKTNIALSTAMAGEMLGMKAIYLDAGSGAQDSVPVETVKAIRQHIDLPLLVGGGIRDAETASGLAQAGADILVFGTLAEKEPEKFEEIIQLLNK